jgi:hypothetical protein
MEDHGRQENHDLDPAGPFTSKIGSLACQPRYTQRAREGLCALLH